MGAPWYRFYSEMLNDRKISFVRQVTGKPRVIIVGAWATILALANDSPIRGALLLAEDIPVTIEDLAMQTDLEVEDVQALVDNFQHLKMLEVVNSTFYVSNWGKRQFANDISTERVQRWRERQKEEAKDGEDDSGDEGDETPEGGVSETLLQPLPGVTVTDQSRTDSDAKAEREFARAHENLPPTDPDNPESAAWIADLESTTPPPRDPPHSEEELHERVKQASAGYYARAAGQPWLAWGADSRDVKPRNGTPKEAIQQVGYLLEHEFGVRPAWNSCTRVKDWVTGLAELWETADGDVGVIRQAASEYRQLKDKDGRPFRISRPQSLFNTLSGMMSEKRERTKPQPPPAIGGQRFRKVQVGA